jgi:hypothetical protein
MFWIVEVLMADDSKRLVNVFAGSRDTAILRAGQMSSDRDPYDRVWAVYPMLEGEVNEQPS